jgi:hypothetical protein
MSAPMTLVVDTGNASDWCRSLSASHRSLLDLRR